MKAQWEASQESGEAGGNAFRERPSTGNRETVLSPLHQKAGFKKREHETSENPAVSAERAAASASNLRETRENKAIKLPEQGVGKAQDGDVITSAPDNPAAQRPRAQRQRPSGDLNKTAIPQARIISRKKKRKPRTPQTGPVLSSGFHIQTETTRDVIDIPGEAPTSSADAAAGALLGRITPMKIVKRVADDDAAFPDFDDGHFASLGDEDSFVGVIDRAMDDSEAIEDLKVGDLNEVSEPEIVEEEESEPKFVAAKLDPVGGYPVEPSRVTALPDAGTASPEAEEDSEEERTSILAPDFSAPPAASPEPKAPPAPKPPTTPPAPPVELPSVSAKPEPATAKMNAVEGGGAQTAKLPPVTKKPALPGLGASKPGLPKLGLPSLKKPGSEGLSAQAKLDALLNRKPAAPPVKTVSAVDEEPLAAVAGPPPVTPEAPEDLGLGLMLDPDEDSEGLLEVQSEVSEGLVEVDFEPVEPSEDIVELDVEPLVPEDELGVDAEDELGVDELAEQLRAIDSEPEDISPEALLPEVAIEFDEPEPAQDGFSAISADLLESAEDASAAPTLDPMLGLDEPVSTEPAGPPSIELFTDEFDAPSSSVLQRPTDLGKHALPGTRTHSDEAAPTGQHMAVSAPLPQDAPLVQEDVAFADGDVEFAPGEEAVEAPAQTAPETASSKKKALFIALGIVLMIMLAAAIGAGLALLG